MNTALSICIPTYNRSAFLRECLEAFLPLVAPHQIPICVSDNGSSDNTLEMLEQFRRDRYPLLTYRTNAENHGIDQNMVDVIGMATTKYAWLFGDDDIPEPAAIEQILPLLANGPAVVVVNASTWNASLSERVEERRVRIYENQFYGPGDHNRLLVDAASYVTYLGGLVVDVSAWRSVDWKPYLQTDYLHVAVVFRYVVGRTASFCVAPLIRLRLQPPSWLSRYFEVEMINWPRTVWSLPGESYAAEAKRAVVDEVPVREVRRIAAMRGYGHYNRAAFEKHVAPAKGVGAARRFVFLAISRLPSTWFRTALIMYLRIRQLAGGTGNELALFRLREVRRW